MTKNQRYLILVDYLLIPIFAMKAQYKRESLLDGMAPFRPLFLIMKQHVSIAHCSSRLPSNIKPMISSEYGQSLKHCPLEHGQTWRISRHL